MSGEFILIIGGMPALIDSMTLELRSASYTVLRAETGSEALRLLDERRPDLVLCGVELPDMSCTDLSLRIKSDAATRGIPVIQISATPASDAGQNDGSRGGAADLYLAGPLEPKVLQAVVNVTLQLRRTEIETEQAFERERIAREQAEEATRLKDEFLANLSHELRTPMNIIIGWAHLLRNGTLAEEQKVRAAEAIERAARSQAQLIEDLLDVSRIVTGKFRMQMQGVKIGLILKSAVESLRMVASGKQISVSLSQGAAGAKVRGDPNRLQQVFWNLLSNAVKFTPAGGRVEVQTHSTETEVSVTVTDTGVGIASDFLPHVFDRFRQADSTSTRPHTGMGLGLAIVRHVVELHGGTVRAASPGPDGGSSFTVILPLSQPALAEEPTDADQGACASDRGRQRRLLLVDDDADAREVTVAGLEKAGFQVQAVGTAQEALLLLDHWHPDAIVSDIGMPGMDGYEFIRLLRSRPADRGGQVAALALTGFAGSEDAMRAHSTGYDAHIAKPITPQDLATAIGKHLGSDPAAGS